ncbi:dihydroorotase [Desulfopila inferna]|nr:dihydroorotase [Desulfopila inferna]
MQTVILRNGRLIDPANGIDQENAEVWVTDGVVTAPQRTTPEDALIFDVTGKWITPGLIDMHVHLREPGAEYKETIESGTQSAAAGGFTAVACMPNTDPVNDCAAVTRFILEKAAGCSARVYPVGSISSGSAGKSLAVYGEMKDAGAVAVSDDGLPVLDSQLMRRAMEYSTSYNMVVISHAEESSLSRNGCMNEGDTSTRLGLKGIPAAAESIMVFREIALSELTGVPIHIAHVSTADSVALIRAAKKRGVKVTAETAPHYFTLTEEAVIGYNANAKMNPPLRSAQDREEIRRALADGTLDAIATDHAPHSILEKETEFSRAANGIIGLETSLPLTLALVREKILTPAKMIELMSVNPAAILNVPGGSLALGKPADLVVIDPEKRYRFSQDAIVSKSKNSPFLDWDLQGRAMLTMVGGRITHDELT